MVKEIQRASTSLNGAFTPVKPKRRRVWSEDYDDLTISHTGSLSANMSSETSRAHSRWGSRNSSRNSSRSSSCERMVSSGPNSLAITQPLPSSLPMPANLPVANLPVVGKGSLVVLVEDGMSTAASRQETQRMQEQADQDTEEAATSLSALAMLATSADNSSTGSSIL